MTTVLAVAPIVALAGLAGTTLVLGIWLARRVRLARARAQATREPAHTGATETWSPMSSVAHVGTAPELTTVSMQMVADHDALVEVSRALDAFDDAVSDALSRFLRDLPAVRIALGELDETELYALLAGERELVPA